MMILDETMKRLEHEAETKLLSKLNAMGLKAHHIDCTVDGFPDAVVIGKSVILVEMKAQPETTRISEAFEPSQPVFMHDAAGAGCSWGIYIYNEWEGVGTVHAPVTGILSASMRGDRLSDLPILFQGKPIEAAAFLAGCTG